MSKRGAQWGTMTADSDIPPVSFQMRRAVWPTQSEQEVPLIMAKNYFDLTGRVAVVTGCSSGLGVQMAKALANQGANIVALAFIFAGVVLVVIGYKYYVRHGLPPVGHDGRLRT